MDTLKVNTSTLANLYEQFPNSFSGITLDGKYLLFKGIRCDISEFNINDLFDDRISFASNLDSLSPDDVFSIINLHSTFLKSRVPIDQPIVEKKNKKEVNNEKGIEEIKKSNPLLKNITVAERVVDGHKEEFINIVDMSGHDTLFRNDFNIDILGLYKDLQVRNSGIDILPEFLIRELSQKAYNVKLRGVDSFMDRNDTDPEFLHMIETVNEPYKGDKTVKVLGNQKENVVVIADSSDLSNHKIVTFNKNKYGDLVINNHERNVDDNDSLNNDGKHQNNVTSTNKNETSEVVAYLISDADFYRLVNSNNPLSKKNEQSIYLYYDYLNALNKYRDYLLPELQMMLSKFEGFIFELEYNHDNPLTKRQEEAIKMRDKMVTSKNNTDNMKKENIKDNVLKLEYKRNQANSGSVSLLLVMAIIIIVAVGLVIFTMKFL